ncbi:MAG: 7,8-didemethyl-8-hydroxy-5-deazariboflavin synthase subunit CofH, partial [Candidatus Nitrosopolaris sp.]
MTFDSILKNLDPVISNTLDRALSNKEISVDQANELFDADGTEMNMILIVADELRRRTVGENVTYVINRNINFTNVCIKR